MPVGKVILTVPVGKALFLRSAEEVLAIQKKQEIAGSPPAGEVPPEVQAPAIHAGAARGFPIAVLFEETVLHSGIGGNRNHFRPDLRLPLQVPYPKPGIAQVVSHRLTTWGISDSGREFSRFKASEGAGHLPNGLVGGGRSGGEPHNANSGKPLVFEVGGRGNSPPRNS